MSHYPYTLEQRLTAFWTRVAICEHGYDCPFCCWPWEGSTLSSGRVIYGRLGFRFDKYGHELAHRLSWKYHHQQDLPRRDYYCHIRHLCNNSLCVNFDHLSRGTAKQNYEDMRHAGTSLHGEAIHSAKLCDEDVLKARQLRKDGLTYSKIATIIGKVSPLAIGKVCRRERWTHI